MTKEQQSTAARLADDPRRTYPGAWNWRDEVVAFLRTLAAQPDDAAAGDAVAKWMNAFADMSLDRDRHAAALRKLVLMARTSGGTAGLDDELCKACDAAEALLVETKR